MRFTIIMLMMLAVVPCLAGAVTESSAYAISNLISYGSDFSAVRTVSDNSVITPDLNFNSDGIINTEYTLGEKGSYNLIQGITSSEDNNGGLDGSCTFYNTFSGSQVTDANLKLIGTLKTSYPNNVNPYKAETTNFGFSLASPGTDDYTFSLTGGHKTVSTATLTPAPEWQTEDPKIYSVSLDEYPINLDQPADLLQDNVKLNFNVAENKVAYYDYDFSRNLEIGDVSSSSAMQLFHKS
jgi:hypothetical protein